MRPSPWVSAHLFYHADLTTVIRRLAGPLTLELERQGLLRRAFFVRYWQRGPHLRLRLLPARARDRARVQAELERAAAAFFARHPAPDALDQEAFRQTAAALSRFEYQEERLEPLAPNNSLAYQAYEPELQPFGGAAARGAVERHFAESSAVALALIERDRPIALGLALAFQLLALAACEVAPAQLPALGAQLQEAYGRSLGAPAPLIAEALAARYAAEGRSVEPLVARLLRAVARPEGVQLDPLSLRWSQSVRGLYRRLVALERGGRLAGEPRAIVLRCLHLHHNRLGLKLLEEAYLGHLMARAVTAALAETAAPAHGGGAW